MIESLEETDGMLGDTVYRIPVGNPETILEKQLMESLKEPLNHF